MPPTSRIEAHDGVRADRASRGVAVRVRGLRKAYRGTLAVDGISFDVAEGEVFGLVGPNGSGKTTTVECLQGLRRPDGGTIEVLGLDPARQGRRLRGLVGSQLQESALPDRITVKEALALFSSLAHGRDWVTLMSRWGLETAADTPFSALSGGQRQRLFVALALVGDPHLVFLDEMTAGLDPAARRTAWELVAAIRDRGTTVVLVTHFMDEAEHLCDRIGVMRAGRLIALDTPGGLRVGAGGPARVRFSCADDVAFLADLPEVAEVRRRGDQVEVAGSGPLLAQVAAALVARGIAPEDLRPEIPTLEDVVLSLTRGEG